VTRNRTSPRRSDLALLAALSISLCGIVRADSVDTGGDEWLAWSEQFAREVDHRLDVPPAEQQRYMESLRQALAGDGLPDPTPQAFVLVDRSAQVQAAMIVLRTPGGDWQWLGATAVSTGKTGTFEHFLTPLGVYAHTLDNPDFRAQGTLNKNHIRGYGARGRRVFDFGWQTAERGWGEGGTSRMRLQMHATDPRLLEPRLGQVGSEGCIRIPATLNAFLDTHGVLDADYEQALSAGETLWVIKSNRQTIPWPGRYMVIIDSQTLERPPWSPLPALKLRSKAATPGSAEPSAQAVLAEASNSVMSSHGLQVVGGPGRRLHPRVGERPGQITCGRNEMRHQQELIGGTCQQIPINPNGRIEGALVKINEAMAQAVVEADARAETV